MNYKTLKISDKNSILSVFINQHEKIAIDISNNSDDYECSYQIIKMELSDALALKLELEELISELK